ncbi:unnamed protein product, partial [Mesorhabditis spiculigera]
MASSGGEWVVTMDEDGQHDPADIGGPRHCTGSTGHLVYAQLRTRHPTVRYATRRRSRRNELRLVLGEVGRSVAAYAGSEAYLDVALGWIAERSPLSPVQLQACCRISGEWFSSSGTKGLRMVSLIGFLFAVGGLVIVLYVLASYVFSTPASSDPASGPLAPERHRATRVTMNVPTWVVGSGGLPRQLRGPRTRSAGADIRTSRVPWGEPALAREILFADARKLVTDAAGGPWRMAWCAGQNQLMKDVLDELGTADAGVGTVFHASSAGGVYAGAPGAPHTETSATNPLADYGRVKARCRIHCSRIRLQKRNPHCHRKISQTLYGPGQNLAKPQGLISHLCRGYLLSMPISIYVPMDTLRDYVLRLRRGRNGGRQLHPERKRRSEPTVTKIYASGRSVTIGAILGACHTVFRKRPNAVLASSPLASAQARDLRLRSIVD